MKITIYVNNRHVTLTNSHRRDFDGFVESLKFKPPEDWEHFGDSYTKANLRRGSIMNLVKDYFYGNGFIPPEHGYTNIEEEFIENSVGINDYYWYAHIQDGNSNTDIVYGNNQNYRVTKCPPPIYISDSDSE